MYQNQVSLFFKSQIFEQVLQFPAAETILTIKFFILNQVIKSPDRSDPMITVENILKKISKEY